MGLNPVVLTLRVPKLNLLLVLSSLPNSTFFLNDFFSSSELQSDRRRSCSAIGSRHRKTNLDFQGSDSGRGRSQTYQDGRGRSSRKQGLM